MANIVGLLRAPADVPTPGAGYATLFIRLSDGIPCIKDSTGAVTVLVGLTNADLIAYAQPLDSDLTAIAALTTTGFGRSFLDRVDAAAGRTLLGLGSAALNASGDFQPIDADLSAIAALSTTSFGRGFLALADALAARTLIEPIQPTSMTATPATITTTTETVIHQMTLAANALVVGTTIRVTCHGIITATAPTITGRLKIGTLGTTGDTEICVTNPAATPVVTGTGWVLEFYVTCRSTGSGGTVLGNGDLTGTAPAKTIRTTTAAVNTTVQNFLSVTLVIGGTTPVCTVVNAFFDTVKQ